MILAFVLVITAFVALIIESFITDGAARGMEVLIASFPVVYLACLMVLVELHDKRRD